MQIILAKIHKNMHFVCFLIEKWQKYYILCLGNLHMSEKSCNFALA